LANSLQEQLLKAGLVDKDKVNRAKKAKQQKEKQQRHARQKSQDESTRLARQAMAKEAERNRELNRQKNEAARLKAITAEIDQLIQAHQLPLEDAEIAYNFTDGGKIRRIYVTEQAQGQLSRGQAAIVRLSDRYALVSAEVAEKIARRDAARVVLHNSHKDEGPDDDPYAEFKVPDDLMW
jgi:uncharacterized protein YaiL (DUF2058 family)